MIVQVREVAQEFDHAVQTSRIYSALQPEQYVNATSSTAHAGTLNPLFDGQPTSAFHLIVQRLPCVVCGISTSRTGDSLVFCDEGVYCAGGLACHQLCMPTPLLDTSGKWSCHACTDRASRTPGCDDDDQPIAALLRKQLSFRGCLRQAQAMAYIPVPQPAMLLVFEPGQHHESSRYTVPPHLTQEAGSGGQFSIDTFLPRSKTTLKEEVEEALDVGEELDDLAQARKLELASCGKPTTDATSSLDVIMRELLAKGRNGPIHLTCNPPDRQPTLLETRNARTYGSHLALGKFRAVFMEGNPRLQLPYNGKDRPVATADQTTPGRGIKRPAIEPVPDDDFFQPDDAPLDTLPAAPLPGRQRLTSEAPTHISMRGYGLHQPAVDNCEDDPTLACTKCGHPDSLDGNKLVLCDGCGCSFAYHLQCMVPPLTAVPADDWFCPECLGDDCRSSVTDESIGEQSSDGFEKNTDKSSTASSEGCSADHGSTCLICQQDFGTDDNPLILCDSCSNGEHLLCTDPRLEKVPEGDWHCARCRASNEGRQNRNPLVEEVLSGDEEEYAAPSVIYQPAAQQVLMTQDLANLSNEPLPAARMDALALTLQRAIAHLASGGAADVEDTIHQALNELQLAALPTDEVLSATGIGRLVTRLGKLRHPTSVQAKQLNVQWRTRWRSRRNMGAAASLGTEPSRGRAEQPAAAAATDQVRLWEHRQPLPCICLHLTTS